MAQIRGGHVRSFHGCLWKQRDELLPAPPTHHVSAPGVLSALRTLGADIMGRLVGVDPGARPAILATKSAEPGLGETTVASSQTPTATRPDRRAELNQRGVALLRKTGREPIRLVWR